MKNFLYNVLLIAAILIVLLTMPGKAADLNPQHKKCPVVTYLFKHPNYATRDQRERMKFVADSLKSKGFKTLDVSQAPAKYGANKITVSFIKYNY